MIRHCVAIDVGQPAAHPEIRRAVEGLAQAPEVVYLWEDHTVTTLPLPDSALVEVPDSDMWHDFCVATLGASSPD